MNNVQKCTVCGAKKNQVDFKKNKLGYRTVCKDCPGARSHTELKKRYYPEKKYKGMRGPDISRLKSAYGLTLEDYKQLHKSQNNKCAICKYLPAKNGRRLGVDHSHVTGKVRGLLCQPCNLLLGSAKDNLSTLRAAIKYLEENA